MSLKCYGNYIPKKNRQTKRKNSLKKYLEYSKKEDQLFEKVKVGIENYLDYIKINKIETAFIKHAITYFNNQSWLDELFHNKTKKARKKWKSLFGMKNIIKK